MARQSEGAGPRPVRPSRWRPRVPRLPSWSSTRCAAPSGGPRRRGVHLPVHPDHLQRGPCPVPLRPAPGRGRGGGPRPQPSAVLGRRRPLLRRCLGPRRGQPGRTRRPGPGRLDPGAVRARVLGRSRRRVVPHLDGRLTRGRGAGASGRRASCEDGHGRPEGRPLRLGRPRAARSGLPHEPASRARRVRGLPGRRLRAPLGDGPPLSEVAVTAFRAPSDQGALDDPGAGRTDPIAPAGTGQAVPVRVRGASQPTMG